MSDDQIKNILNNSKTIAMVGVSSEKKGEDPKNLTWKKKKVLVVELKKYECFDKKFRSRNQKCKN